MSFQPDWCFESLTEAFNYILSQYSLQPNAHVWARSTSGLVYPRELPSYLFRGECGVFPATTDGGRRLQAEVLASWRVSTVQHGRGAAWKARFQSGGTALQGTLQPRSDRSEERRVGKECRSR